MKTVLVTGSDGFIGKNLIAQLALEDKTQVVTFTKSNTSTELSSAVLKADFIFHLAGVNRPKDESEFTSGNAGLTQEILDILMQNNKKTPLLLASSVQSALDNPYGVSKKSAEDAVLTYSKATGAATYIYRLPNVFGKWCKPNYNSVVATFCHNIARNLDITIKDAATKLTLVYIDDVVDGFVKTAVELPTLQPDDFCSIDRTFTITLGELSAKLYALRDSRDSLLMPALTTFDRFLYATFTSYFETTEFGYSLVTKRDDRGWLAEFIKSESFGQTFISRTKPGISRGNHWHHTKIEKFLVVDGQAEIKFRKLNTSEVLTYKVDGNDLRVLDIPAGYVHSITNVGETDLLTLFWADEVFDPQKPDTHYEGV